MKQGFFLRHLFIALWMAFMTSFVLGCAYEKNSDFHLFQVHQFASENWESGDTLEIEGSEFPVGKDANVYFTGFLRKPSLSEEVSFQFKAVGLAKDARTLRLDFSPDMKKAFFGLEEESEHTVFIGKVQVSFFDISGASYTESLPEVHLDFLPSRIALHKKTLGLLRAQTILQELGVHVEKQSLETGDALLVTQVEANKSASFAGINQGDVLLQAGGFRLYDVSDLAWGKSDLHDKRSDGHQTESTPWVLQTQNGEEVRSIKPEHPGYLTWFKLHFKGLHYNEFRTPAIWVISSGLLLFFLFAPFSFFDRFSKTLSSPFHSLKSSGTILKNEMSLLFMTMVTSAFCALLQVSSKPWFLPFSFLVYVGFLLIIHVFFKTKKNRFWLLETLLSILSFAGVYALKTKYAGGLSLLEWSRAEMPWHTHMLSFFLLSLSASLVLRLVRDTQSELSQKTKLTPLSLGALLFRSGFFTLFLFIGAPTQMRALFESWLSSPLLGFFTSLLFFGLCLFVVYGLLQVQLFFTKSQVSFAPFLMEPFLLSITLLWLARILAKKTLVLFLSVLRLGRNVSALPSSSPISPPFIV